MGPAIPNAWASSQVQPRGRETVVWGLIHIQVSYHPFRVRVLSAE